MPKKAEPAKFSKVMFMIILTASTLECTIFFAAKENGAKRNRRLNNLTKNFPTNHYIIEKVRNQSGITV